ncbi:hypothetical protein BS47DRAFT_364502 [Hydnum rufescens UP504]|uniref:Uncharacterized protein n=1 Tax=Hydnum rufescens UP504 TaxID=1448309 RepID=A0A9P6AJJ3_9AGAM|nr:hypothetical protein BS47DRAFT_364502 [Hydnum rufescens UP504]
MEGQKSEGCGPMAELVVVNGYPWSPSSVPTSTSGGTSHQDPFTGSSCYHGAEAAPPSSVGSAFVDPFTGELAYRSSPSASAPTSQSPEQPSTPAAVSILPVVCKHRSLRLIFGTDDVRIALSFKHANIPAMHAKLADIDTAIINQPIKFLPNQFFVGYADRPQFRSP